MLEAFQQKPKTFKLIWISMQKNNFLQIFFFCYTRNKKIFKGETAESLQDKVNKTTQETLTDPRFNSLKIFQHLFKLTITVFQTN